MAMAMAIGSGSGWLGGMKPLALALDMALAMALAMHLVGWLRPDPAMALARGGYGSGDPLAHGLAWRWLWTWIWPESWDGYGRWLAQNWLEAPMPLAGSGYGDEYYG